MPKSYALVVAGVEHCVYFSAGQPLFIGTYTMHAIIGSQYEYGALIITYKP